MGDGAGLIHDNHIYTVGSLQSFCGFNEDAVRCASAGAYHDGSRSCQSQSAGAGDHQYRYCDGHGELKGRAANQPHHHSKQSDTNDYRDKNSSHLIRQLGNRRFGAGGFVHQSDNLGKCGLIAHFVSPYLEVATLVDSGTDDLIADLFIYRNTLAGDCTLVHRASPLQQNTVYRDAFTCLNDENVTLFHFFGGNDRLHTVPDYCGLLGGKVHQLVNCVRGTALGTRLEEFAQSNERENGACSLEIEVVSKLIYQHQISVAKAPSNFIESVDSVGQGGTGTQCD